VRPLGVALVEAKTQTLLTTETLEVVRIVMVAGKDIARYHVAGEITVQCLEVRVEFRIGEIKHELTAGTLLKLER
jgi:hypothetical protein